MVDLKSSGVSIAETDGPEEADQAETEVQFQLSKEEVLMLWEQC